jgi:hypothetical protein
MGFEEWAGMSQMFYDAFTDGRHTIDETLESGDRVALRGSFSGTHTQEARDSLQPRPAVDPGAVQPGKLNLCLRVRTSPLSSNAAAVEKRGFEAAREAAAAARTRGGSTAGRVRVTSR